MEFYKETIMGQVLTQVQADKSNDVYFDQIDDLLDDISNLEYMETDNSLWTKKGLIITDKEINEEDKDDEWSYVITGDAYEYSWLVYQLMDIYQPNTAQSYRLLTTLGYLLNIYTERFDSITEILRITTITSTVFLHPDHLGQDKFKVYPIELPPFGKDF